MIAGALLVAGLPGGAALALCITGPVLGVRLVRALARRRGAARAAVFAFLVVAFAIAAGLLWEASALPDAASGIALALPPLVEQASLAILVALAVVTLLRHGARAFVARAVLFSTLRLDERHAHAIGDDALHMHGPDSGHEVVVHDDHVDYLVEGQLHHPPRATTATTTATSDSRRESDAGRASALRDVPALRDRLQVVDHLRRRIRRREVPRAPRAGCRPDRRRCGSRRSSRRSPARPCSRARSAPPSAWCRRPGAGRRAPT